MRDADACIIVPRIHGKIDVINNTIDTPSVSDANQIYFYQDLINSSQVDSNVFKNPLKIRMGGST
jgi:hypothetical protein